MFFRKSLVVLTTALFSFALLVQIGINTDWLQSLSVEQSAIPVISEQEPTTELVEGEYVSNRVLIKYVEPALKLFYAEPDFSKASVIDFTTLLLPEQEVVSRLSFSSNTVWYKAELEDGTSVEDAINILMTMPGVLVAEPDYIRTIDEEDTGEVIDINATDDDLLNQQYHLDAINIPEARQFLADAGINPGGDRSIIVAVIDTGVDYTHPDLTANMWVNTGEIAGDGIDNDHNGYVDDVYGASTVGNEWSHTGDPYDYHGHGTHVAGIIAADGDNGIGIRGVADNVRIMAVKASGSSGIFNTSDIVEAINYAVANGADVINMSFGGISKSTIEQEALEIAFNSAVLVASAGNSSLPNFPEPLIPGINFYPASYNFVIGVMASTPLNSLASFSNFDYQPQDSNEYEIVAPGYQIISTLPGGKYAKWDGTSMSAPIVSGVAALLKSYFNDPSSHSTRFIMSQIIGTADIPISIPSTIQGYTRWSSFLQVDAYQAFVDVPIPNLTVFEHYIFDGSEVADGNNGNGVIDAGETVQLAFILRNHWGKADDVNVSIDTLTPSGQSDPYVTILTDTVNYGAVGTFNTDDNGIEYNDDQRITGVRNPFVLSVAPETPNDYYIILNITITCVNGLDFADSTIYEFHQRIILTVRSGRELPSIIEEDMTLTNDTYWIIPNATLIPAGVTVNVEEGTTIQFWSNDPEDVYADLCIAYLKVEGTLNINGTEENPVKLLPSELKAAYPVMIFSGTYDWYNAYAGFNANQNVNIKYAIIANPNIGVNTIDHSKFYQNYNYIVQRYLSQGEVVEVPYYGTNVHANYISNSIFTRLGSTEVRLFYADDKFSVRGILEGNLFDSCYMAPEATDAVNNVFLNNFILESTQWGDRWYFTSSSYGIGTNFSNSDFFNNFEIRRDSSTGTTYVRFSFNLSTSEPPLEIANNFAKSLGGYLVSINSAQEEQFLLSNFGVPFYIGLRFDREEGYVWYSGEEVTYTNWSPYYMSSSNKAVSYTWDNRWGVGQSFYPSYFLIEIPGEVLIEDIQLYEEEIYISEISAPYEINFSLSPSTATLDSLQFTSSDTNIVTVDQTGIITPVSIGDATVIISNYDGTIQKSVLVHVTEFIALDHFTISSSTQSMTVGEVGKILVNYFPYNTTEKKLLFTSSDPAVIKVDTVGNITALSGGTATISVYTPDGSMIESTTISVEEYLSEIKLIDAFIISVIGSEDEIITPVLSPYTATDKAISYESSNPSIAYVDETGHLIKLSAGTVVIRVSSVNSDAYDEMIVSVVESAINQDLATDIVATNYSSSTKFFVLMDNGDVWMFGNNIGVATKLNVSNIVQIDAFSGSLIMVDESGTIYYQSYIQDSISLSKITNINNVIQVSAGENHFLALTAEGAVWGWGSNYYGQLGSSGYGNWSTTLIQIDGLSNIVDIAATNYTSFFVDNLGNLYTLGNSGNGNNCDPYLLTISDVQKIDRYGYYSVVAYDSSNRVKTVEAYNSVNDYSLTRNDISMISYSWYDGHSLILLADNSVIVYGSNGYGQLGISSFTDTWNYNNKIPNFSQVSKVMASQYVSAAITTDGKVYVWGRNNLGQLCDFSTTNRPYPIQVNFGVQKDNTALNVNSITPSDGSVYVSVDSQIVVEFNQEILDSVEYGAIRLVDSNQKYVSFSKELILNRLIITPLSSLVGEEEYTLIIPAHAVSGLFGQINSAISMTFTTEPGELYVKDILINEVEINISNNGLSYQIDYELVPYLVDDTFVTWSSSNEGVVTVNEHGVITPVSVGDAIVTVIDNDGLIVRNIPVHVLPYVEMIDFEISTNSLHMFAGEVYTFNVTYLPIDTTEKNLIWTSSNTAVVSVSKSIVTALTGGTATITATSPDGTVTHVVTVTVDEVLTDIEFDSEYMAINLSSDPFAISVALLPITATNKEVTWSSTNNSILSVDSQGIVTIHSSGTVVIRVCSAVDDEIFDEIIITVDNYDFDQMRIVDMTATADRQFYALDSLGGVWTWGYRNGNIPRKINIEPILYLDGYSEQLILLGESGNIYTTCYYTYGNGFNVISSLQDIVQVSASANYFMALSSSGKVWGWGTNEGGGLSPFNIGNWTDYFQMPDINNVKQILTNYGSSSFYLTNDGDVFYRGSALETKIGQLWKISTQTYESIHRAGGNVYGVTSEGALYMLFPTLAESELYSSYPNAVSYSSSNEELLLMADGNVYGCGSNTYGSLGIENQTYVDSMTLLPDLTHITQIYAYSYTTFFINEDGVLYGMGRSDQDQLAWAPTYNFNPVEIPIGLKPFSTAFLPISTTPVSEEELFDIDHPIVIEFDRTIESSYMFGMVRVLDDAGRYVNIDTEIVANKLLITPSMGLSYDTTYTVIVPYAGLVDFFEQYSSEVTFSFTTRPVEYYVRDIVLNETNVYISNNNLTYQIDYDLKPYVIDDSYITWTSNNEDIVTIDEHGVITPHAPGNTTVTISAIDGSISKSVNVYVAEYIPMTAMNITETEKVVFVGQVYKVTVSYTPINTTETKLTWTSSDTSVATVDQIGNVTLLTGGTVTISAVDNTHTFSDSIVLHVQEPVTYLNFFDNFLVLNIDDSDIQIPLNIGPDTATNKAVVWESSNPEIAFVDSQGCLQILKTGVLVIRATAENTNVYDEMVISITEDVFTNLEVVEVRYANLGNYQSTVFALMSDHTVWYWGELQQLPKKLPYENIIDIDTSEYDVIMLKADSTILCYSGISGSSIIFNSVTSIPNVIQVQITNNHKLALSSDGSVWGWGDNYYSQLGGEESTYYSAPIQIAGLSNIIEISDTHLGSVFLTNAGEVYYLGYSSTNRRTPYWISTLSDITHIESAGNNSFFATSINQTIFCVDSYNFSLSTVSSFKTNTVEVSRSDSHYIFLTSDGSVYTYSPYDDNSMNAYLELGIPSETDVIGFHKVAFDEPIAHVYATNDNSFAISVSGKLYIWGNNVNGELANLSKENNMLPQPIHFGLTSDLTPIQVKSTSPINNEMFFDSNGSIVITFNKAVYASSMYPYIYLYDKDNHFVSITKTLALNKLIITPNVALNYEENYHLTLPSSSLKDMFGLFNSSYNLYFKTAPEVPYVYGINLDETSISLSTATTEYQIRYSLNPSQYVDDTYITWSSSDDSVVSVNSHGLLVVNGIGTATVTIRTNDGRIEKNIIVNVIQEVPIMDFSFDSETKTIYVGNVYQPTITYNPSDTTEKTLIWSSSDSTNAIVDESGHITALRGGSVIITATSEDGLVSHNLTIVIEEPVTEVQFTSWAFVTSLETQDETLPLSIYPDSATDKSIIWESSNPNIAYVDENNHLVKLSVGNVLIRATSEANALSDEIYVSITETMIEESPVRVESTFTSDGSKAYFALMNDGTVWAWSNSHTIPKKLSFTNIIDIDTGLTSVIFLKDDSTIYYNNYAWNFVNDGSYTTMNSLSNIVQVKASLSWDGTYLARDIDGNVWGWGRNSTGTLGQANIGGFVPMTLVYGGQDAVDMEMTYYVTAILTDTGYIKEIGRINDTIQTTFTSQTLTGVVNLECYSLDYFIFYTESKDIYVQYAYNGSLYTHSQVNSDNLAPFSNMDIVSYQNVIGSGYNGYLLADGRLFLSGGNAKGQMGNGEISNVSYYYQQVLIDEPVVSFTMTNESSVAITASGKIYVWGNNGDNSLGIYGGNTQPTPIQIFLGMNQTITSQLSLIDQTVYNNDTDIPVDQELSFEYNVPVIQSNNALSSYMSDSAGKYVAVSIEMYLNKLMVVPLTTLKYGETYTLHIAYNSVINYNKQPNNETAITFTTETAPIISSVDNTGYQVWTLEDIEQAAQEFIDGGMSSGVYNNAILNNIIDPNTDTWMRFIAYSGEQYKFLTYNYWGTTDAFLIGKQIRDFEDYPDLSKIIYKPFLTTAPETAYPFVTDVFLTTDLEEETNIVSIGVTTFTVEFNRDMDITQPLGVYFGPDYPYTDYKVEGEWVDARTWVGTFIITPLTGDGKMFFRIRDGRAADDHWLTLGDDDGRFLFEIITSGAESMNLQASGAEGRVILSWIQDDFELLAGYDVYRSTSIDGYYEKINSTVIPKDEKEYSDYNVTPGMVYYYKFTVVKTDLTSSDFSNTAAAAAYDTIAPTMSHLPIRTVNLGTDMLVSVYAYDNIGVESVLLYYRAYGEVEYHIVDLIKGQYDQYSTRLFITEDYIDGLEYYLVVGDELTTIYSGTDSAPHFVEVKDIPTITSISPSRVSVQGGEEITISGANFKDGSNVYIGNKEALFVTFIDENTIKVTAPNNFPSLVNVTVENPTGDQSTLTNALEYYSDEVQAQIPTVKGQVGQEILVPVTLQNLSGLISMDLGIGYDASVLQYVGYIKGNIATRFTTIVNSSVSGTIQIAMASDVTISGSGEIIYLKFKVLKSPDVESAITLSKVELNGGNIDVTKVDGKFIEDVVFTYQGTVYYYANQTTVNNVRIVLSGEKEYVATTFADGSYSLQEIEAGNYVLTIEKRDETSAISAFDASMILRKSVGLDSLNSNQMIAADVNNDGAVNSFDAALILQYVAGLRVLPFEGRTNIWVFSENNSNLGYVSSSTTGKVITAILIGDVSGNYQASTSTSIADVIKVEQIRYNEETQTIQVPISLKALSQGVFSVETTVYFNPALTVTNVTFNSLLENTLKVVNTNNAGEVRIVLAGVSEIPEMDDFVTITFSADNTNLQRYEFSIGDTMFNENANVQAILNVLNLGTTTDLNNDGIFNSADVEIMMSLVNKSNQDQDISAMDYNHDGIIDIFDIIAMKQQD